MNVNSRLEILVRSDQSTTTELPSGLNRVASFTFSIEECVPLKSGDFETHSRPRIHLVLPKSPPANQ